MSDASDASDAVSTPSTVFSRVAASAAWKRLNRLMPALACPNLQPYLPQQTLHGLKHHGIGNHRK